jgi:N-acetylglutamate synthase-like GNAT family acetyltransferase
MADCEYQIGGKGKFYSESEFKKLLSEGYLDKVMMEKSLTIKGIKPNEAIASSFQLPSAIQPTIPVTEVKTEEVVTPTGDKNNYKIAQDVTAEVSKENPDASVLLTPKGEDLSLTAVYVSKENRGKGIGTKVLDSVKKQADKLGKKIVLDATTELDEETDLGRLESFYQNNGFTKIGKNKFEYNPTTETKAKEVVTPAAEVKTDIKSKSVDELEKRMFEIEESRDENDRREFNEIEKEVDRREWNSVLNAPLNEVNKVLDDLAKKDKEMPNGFGTFIDKADIRQSKAVVSKYSEEVSKREAIKDFKDAFFGRPTTWYADGLKLREATRAYTEQGGSFKELLGSVKQEFESDGFTEQDAAGVINIKLQEIQNKGLEKVTPTETVTKTEEKVTEPTAETAPEPKQEEQKIAVNPSQGYSFTYGSEQEIPNELKGVSPINRSESTVGRGKKAKTNIRLTFSGQQLIDAGLGQQESQPTPETKQPTKEAIVAKNMADILRKAKIKMEGGTAMASFLPGFEAVWNGSIETVSKAIELGGITAGNFRQSIEAGMKALRNTDAYKAITDSKERAKISSQYRKILKSAYAEGYDVDTDNLRAAEFDTFNEELEASKEKEKFAGGLSAKELSDLKAKAKKFVNDNLPVDNYRKTEVKSYVAKNFDKAKNVADIQKNLEAVNALLEGKEAKMAEKSKEQLIKDINSKVKANSKKVVSTNRRTGRKTGKISLSAQEQLDDLAKQGVFNNLEALSQTELSDINNNIDSILEKGKADKKFQNAVNDSKKRTDQAMILEELAGKPQTLNGEQEILDKLTEESGVVIVNGQSMNKSRFETFIKDNPDADLSDIKFYPNEQSRVKNLRSKTQGPIRKAVVSVVQSIRDLETAVKLLGKGSPRMKKWLEEEIMKPIREGQNRKQDFVSRTIKEYNRRLDEIFGTVAGISRAKYVLNNLSGITTGETSLKGRESDTLTNAQVVHYYGLINNQDSSLTELSENKKNNIEILKKYNNVSAKEINDYMNDPKNKKLLDYYNLLNEKYNGEFADTFVPIIEDLYGIKIERGNYWPEPKSGGAMDAGSLLDLESGNSKNISAIAPQMKHNNNAQVAFEATNADDMFRRYVESMAHAKEFLPVTQSVYSLLSKNNIPHIINKFNDINKYNSFLADLGIVLTDKSPFQNDFTSSLANINALTTLMLRLKSVPQQVTAALHYYHAGIKDGVYPHDILAATLPVNKEEIKFIKDLFIDNTYLWTRMSGGMSNQETQALKVGIDKFIETYVSKKGSNVNEFISDLTKLATNSGMSFIKLGDFIAITAPGGGGSFALAQFRKNKAEGNDYESSRTEAMQRWFEETERTQQPSIARETLSNVTYSSVYRTLFPFMSANNAMVKKINKGLIDISDWKNLNNNERGQAVADVLYYTIFAGVPFALVSSGGLLAWAKYNEEDDDEANAKKDRVLFDAFADGIQGNMNTLGLAGKIASMAANTLRDKEFFNNVPLFERMAHTANIFTGLWNVEGDISKLDKQELNDFWKGWEPTEFEMRKMKGMTPTERDQYLKDNPFAVKKFYAEVGEEYKKLSSFQKMGAGSKKSLEKVLGTKNFNELVEGVGAYVEGDADFSELLLGMKTRDKDFYFKNKDEDKIFEGLFGEKYKEKEVKSRRSSSKPGSFPKQKFGPKIPKF